LKKEWRKYAQMRTDEIPYFAQNGGQLTSETVIEAGGED
jgi:hypothetical protein